MISARLWRERRTFWSALLFWSWLATFIFGFAGSDAFHNAHCPEQWALVNAHNANPVAAQLTALPAVHLDFNCPSCLLQLDAQGVLAIIALLVAPALLVLIFAGLRPVYLNARAPWFGARGPPVQLI